MKRETPFDYSDIDGHPPDWREFAIWKFTSPSSDQVEYVAKPAYASDIQHEYQEIEAWLYAANAKDAIETFMGYRGLLR